MTYISEGSSLSIALNFEVITCYKCGVPFAVPAYMRKNLLDSRDTFYCPSGHPQSYIAKTEAEKYKELYEQKQRELSNKDCEIIQLEGELHKTQRKLKRVHNGTCPCCKRSFADLQRHMKTKHPELLKK